MNLTPDQRMRIIKWMGDLCYENPYFHDGRVYYYSYHNCMSGVSETKEYTPDTNDAQAFELLERLEGYEGYLTIGTFDDNPELKYVELVQGAYTGENLKIAICHAVLSLLENR